MKTEFTFPTDAEISAIERRAHTMRAAATLAGVNALIAWMKSNFSAVKTFLNQPVRKTA